jgi:hypothetical protein
MADRAVQPHPPRNPTDIRAYCSGTRRAPNGGPARTRTGACARTNRASPIVIDSDGDDAYDDDDDDDERGDVTSGDGVAEPPIGHPSSTSTSTSAAATGDPDRGRPADGRVVASFDLGESATAYCVGTVRDGRRVSVSGVGIATLGSITSAQRAVWSMWDVLSRVPRADVYLIEEQPSINRKTCMLEAALAALASGVYRASVVHVPTSRISEHFELPTGKVDKKKAAVETVCRLVNEGDLVLSQDALSLFAGVKRKHDVADALLQFTWYATSGRKESTLRTPASSCRPWERCQRATAPKNTAAERRRCAQVKRKSDKALEALVSGPQRKKRKVIAGRRNAKKAPGK